MIPETQRRGGPPASVLAPGGPGHTRRQHGRGQNTRTAMAIDRGVRHAGAENPVPDLPCFDSRASDGLTHHVRGHRITVDRVERAAGRPGDPRAAVGDDGNGFQWRR